MDFDETNILDRNMKRINTEGEGSGDEGREDWRWSSSDNRLLVKMYF